MISHGNTMELVKLFLIISLGINITNTVSSPKLTWPLCDKSFGFELNKKYDALYPKLTDCFEVDDGVKFSTTATSPSALHFNGSSASSFVELDVVTGVITDKEFGISLFAHPEELPGTLLYYKADSTTAPEVSDVILRMESDGKLHLELKDSSGNILSSISHGSVSIGSWTLVQLGYSRINSETYLTVGGSSSNVSGGTGKFITPGTMRIGQHFDKTESYHGSVACVLMFDKAAGFPDPTKTRSYCDDPGDWISIIPESPSCKLPPTHTQHTTDRMPAITTRITTDVTTTLSQCSPIYVWPFDDKALTEEVVSHQLSYPTALSLCPRTTLNNSTFTSSTLYFDGASISYIRINLNQTFLQRSFTIGLFLCLEERDSGTVLYVSDNQVSGISRLKIQTYWNNVTVTTSNIDGTICGEVLGTNLEIRQWNTLVVTRNTGTGTLELNINNVTSSTNDNCATGDASQPCETYIGTDTRKEEQFRGYLRCLTIFDDVVNSPDIAEVCQDTKVKAYSAPAPPCPVRSEEGIYFRKSATNKKPTGSVLHSTITASKKRCASLCSTFDLCRAFVFQSITRLCFLYDYVTRWALVDAVDHYYFTIVDRE